MDPNGVPTFSRVYSPARMKRRANKSIRQNINEPGVGFYPNRSSSPLGLKVPGNKDYLRILSKKRNSNLENIEPESNFYTKSLAPSKFDKGVSEDSKNAVQKNSSFTHIPLSKAEHSFHSTTSLLDRLSDSTIESIDSPIHKLSVVKENIKVSHGSSKHYVDQNKENEKIKILASLLPDEILRDPVSQKPRLYQTALMFPDVSGFTQLCEKYDKTGMGGPSRLTEVLNGYIGSMISIVLSRNGDVCKFGGDAFLCAWKVTDGSDLTEVVHLAIESAIDIQKNCGEHKTDVGVKLRVKIAVSAGRALFSIIGTKARKYYAVVGPPVMEVRDAEQMCKPGDVIVTSSAWSNVKNYMFYSFTYHTDSRYIKVHDFGPLWKSARADFKIKSNGLLFGDLRPFLKYASRLNIEDIRPFILPPVMRSVDLNRPLDYLTEMRQVAIVFFNVIADFNTLSSESVIHLCNKAFKIVSEIVYKSDGATNKLTLFDKDMAILTVFGLKGFRHELASQVALICAHRALEELKKLKVQSSSAGVTTGMAYCGVIGHPSRKEYTVMGHPVNMAARLMCAYQNIVSCDRSTFLHSKLESNHFEVVQYEYLKGIQSAGPFYKFNLQPKRTKLKLDHEVYPLLGRGKEIKEFENFLKNGMEPDNTDNFMIIFGKARIGKSRLVAKFINIAEKQNFEESKHDLNTLVKIDRLEICVITLTEDDSKVSYATSRLIFQPMLGFSDSSSKEEREDKILTKLGETKGFHLLASLNPIFNVNFALTPQYLALSYQEQADVQMHLVKDLYRKCFPKGEKWLMVIEDAEFMDEESWNLLSWCSNESHKVLYLMSIGQKKALSAGALNCLNHIKAKKITLTEIDKWFYSGLACQILGVKAIPVELENLLQSYKSSGNPGWLESFLLSLLQSGSIYILQVSPQKMKTMGLVAAPDAMLTTTRINAGEKHGSYQWAECLETFETMSNEKQLNVRVCQLGPNFRVGNENEGELTMDVMFIKTIDTLKPLEQLVLKAGSVLGNNMKRNALKFVIAKDAPLDERHFAKAIRNLFEIKILICAKGNLSQSNMLVPRRMILVTSIRKEVVCECTGLDIPEVCKDLPKYANCAFMQFRSSTFRDTVYNLLLDDQKKKFHYSCIEYLRKNTLKCNTCKNLPFKSVFGYEVDDQVVLACTVTPMHGVRSTQLERKSALPIPSLKQKLTKCSFGNTIAQIRNSFYNSENEINLISATEKGDCQCPNILASVYSVLLEHAAGSGRKDIMLEIQLEYASVCLTTHNIPLTMQILEEALTLVNQMKEINEYKELCTPFIYSKIYTLMGATKLSMGRLDESLELLKTSLKHMHKKFPTNTVGIKFLIQNETTKLRFTTELFPDKLLGRASNKKAPTTDLLSECLGLISIVYLYMQNCLLAKYASLKALNKALESNRNFFGLCTAYMTAIDVSYLNKDLETCAKLEICGIDLCKRCNDKIIEIYEWEAICRLYTVIFQTRHVRAEIKEAVFIGFQSIKIASVIRNTNLKLDLIPDLTFALIQLNRLSEAVALLQELEFMSQLDSDNSRRLWYFNICLDFHLYTGFSVVPYEACENSVKDDDELLLGRDPDAKHRLYTSLWLWCVRSNEWELSKSYNKILENFKITDQREIPRNVFTRLKRLEGFLITMVHKMDQRSVYTVNALYEEVHTLMNQLEKDIKVVKLFKPRYQLLKCYYRQIRYRDESYHRILNQAQYQAEKIEDINLHQWILHLKMVWSNAISPIQRDYWIEHSRHNYLEWQESDKVTKKQAVMYSLPLPKF